MVVVVVVVVILTLSGIWSRRTHVRTFGIYWGLFTKSHYHDLNQT
jgi:hypothetical protein